MLENYDVAIVGASLAGAGAALMLGRGGYKVCLLDRAEFPRPKPCGEGLSSYGLKQLETLGLRDSILELPILESEGYCLRSGRARSYLRSPWGKGITIQRTILDYALVTAAAKTPGVDICLSQKVTAISPNIVSTARTKVSAKIIIVACGGNSSLLRKIGCVTRRSGPSRTGISVTYRGTFSKPAKFVHILVKRGYELYCTPLAQGRLNVSILAQSTSDLDLRDVLLSAESKQEVFDEMFFQGEIELPPSGRSGIGNVRRATSMPSLLLAGDAKEEFDPIGGMGMSHALHSGILAAQMAAEFLAGGGATLQSSRRYREPSKQSLTAMRTFTGVSYRTLRASAHFPPLLHFAASPIAGRVLRVLTKELL